MASEFQSFGSSNRYVIWWLSRKNTWQATWTVRYIQRKKRGRRSRDYTLHDWAAVQLQRAPVLLNRLRMLSLNASQDPVWLLSTPNFETLLKVILLTVTFQGGLFHSCWPCKGKHPAFSSHRSPSSCELTGASLWALSPTGRPTAKEFADSVP